MTPKNIVENYLVVSPFLELAQHLGHPSSTYVGNLQQQQHQIKMSNLPLVGQKNKCIK
jgi:hypothetical protein